jgi:hypothetical protein
MTRYELLHAARAVVLLSHEYEGSYNQTLLAGWAEYIGRALGKAAIPGELLEHYAREYLTKAVHVLATNLDKKESLRDLKLVEIERHATHFEEIAVYTKILPKLDDLTIEDVSERKGRYWGNL